MSNRKEIIKLLSLSSEIFGKDVSRETQRFWIISLNDFEINEIEEAFAHHLRYEKFMPRPADIIQKITGITTEQRRQELIMDRWLKKKEITDERK